MALGVPLEGGCGLSSSSSSSSSSSFSSLRSLPSGGLAFTATRHAYLGSSRAKVALFPNCLVIHYGSWDEGEWAIRGDKLEIKWFAEVAPATHRTVFQTDSLSYDEATGGFREKKGLILTPAKPERNDNTKRTLEVLIMNGKSATGQPLILKAMMNLPEKKTYGCSEDGTSKGRTLIQWTTDRKRVSKADVLLFELPYLFKSGATTPPRLKPAHQTWVAISREHPSNPGFPALRKFPSQHRIDHVLDWRLLSDVPASFFQYMYFGAEIDDFFRPHPVRWDDREYVGTAVFSNCITHSKRENYIRDLAIELSPRVKIAGKCRGHATMKLARGRLLLRSRPSSHPRRRPRGSGSMSDDVSASKDPQTGGIARMYKDSKFQFAFESTIDEEWATEKMYHGLLAGSIPVVRGAHNISQFLPCSSPCVINSHDFSDAKELAAYLRKLDKNPREADRYFDWKAAGHYDAATVPLFDRQWRLSIESAGCRLANTLMPGSCPSKCRQFITESWKRAVLRSKGGSGGGGGGRFI